jgi:hypothetical protein
MEIQKTYITKEPLPNLLVTWDGEEFSFLVLDDKPYSISYTEVRGVKTISFSRKINKKRIRFSKSYNQFYKDFFGCNPQSYRKIDKRRIEYKEKLIKKCQKYGMRIISEIGFRMDDIQLLCEYDHKSIRKPHHILNSDSECICSKCQGWTNEYSKDDFLLLGNIIVKKFGVEYLDFPQSTQHIDTTNYNGPTLSPLRRSKTNDRGNENCWEDFWDTWDEFRNELGVGNIEKRQVTRGYQKDDFFNFFMICVNDLKRIPTPDEFTKYRCNEFNGSSFINHIRKDYLIFVNHAKDLTNFEFNSKFFIVGDKIVKSLREVYFVNFCSYHNLYPEYEPNRINCGDFIKEPDFLFNNYEYFEVAGFSGSHDRIRKYWDKLEKAKPIIESMGKKYTIWNFSGDYTSLKFYQELCQYFNVLPSDNIKNEVDILKIFLSYENNSLNKIKEELKKLLTNIINIKPDSKEQKIITSHIKRLNYKNQKTAAKILGVDYNCNSNGHIQGKNSRLTNEIKNGDIFRFIVKNPIIGIKKISDIFNTTSFTIKKYWNTDFNPFKNKNIEDYYSDYNKKNTIQDFIDEIKPIIQEYNGVPNREELKKIGKQYICSMADSLTKGLDTLKRNELEEGEFFYIVNDILGENAPFDKTLCWKTQTDYHNNCQNIINFYKSKNIPFPINKSELRYNKMYSNFGKNLDAAISRFSNWSEFKLKYCYTS